MYGSHSKKKDSSHLQVLIITIKLFFDYCCKQDIVTSLSSYYAIQKISVNMTSDTFKSPSPTKYSPEKVHPQGEKHAPKYSISARTRYRRQDQNPAPSKYQLPPVIGNKQPYKQAAPAYNITSRQQVGI